MTEAQKETLISRMLDAPSSLSDEELDIILGDDELRDIYNASALVSSASALRPELDVKAEWERFRPRFRRKPSPIRWAMRVAAIFLGVSFVSAITVRLIDISFTHHAPEPAIAKAAHPQTQDTTRLQQEEPQAAETVQKLEPGPTNKQKPTVAPTRRLAKAEISVPTVPIAQVEVEIDLDEYLRIQQARIDNDLALQLAEAYMEEYDDLVPFLDAAGVYNAEFDNAIQKVTME